MNCAFKQISSSRGLTKMLGFVIKLCSKSIWHYEAMWGCSAKEGSLPSISNPDLSLGSTVLEAIQTLYAVLSTLRRRELGEGQESILSTKILNLRKLGFTTAGRDGYEIPYIVICAVYKDFISKALYQFQCTSCFHMHINKGPPLREEKKASFQMKSSPSKVETQPTGYWHCFQAKRRWVSISSSCNIDKCDPVVCRICRLHRSF